MLAAMSKRKAHASRNTTRSRNSPPRAVEPEISLFIQAHEADVIRGPRGHAASLALETRIVDGQVIVGEGLIKWRAEGEVEDDERDGELSTGSQAEKAAPVWVDRYASSPMSCTVTRTFPMKMVFDNYMV